MRRAFEEIGYTVYSVNGDYRDRKVKTEDALKQDNVLFAYCESANVPFCISGKRHFPIRFFSDIMNLKKIRKKCKIGFFYRDINWKEKDFYNKNGFIKGIVLYILFRLEFEALIRIIDVLFVPSMEMAELFPGFIKWKKKIMELPPACSEPLVEMKVCNDSNLNVVYSGNTDRSSMYKIDDLLRVISDCPNVSLTVNTEKFDIKYHEIINNYPIKDRLKITNYDFESVLEDDADHDIGIVWQDGPIEDIKKYMPIKLFYYLRLGIPVVGRSGTAYGNFIETNGLGWTFKNTNELKHILICLSKNKTGVIECKKNVLNIRNKHTWKARAKEVESVLKFS